MIKDITINLANQSLLTDSLDDYILVEQPDDNRDDQTGDSKYDHDSSDDDSYDYCDDIPVERNADDHGDDLTIGSNGNSTIPSVLMKDLDEAHAAAELAQIPALELSEESLPSSSDSSVAPDGKAADEKEAVEECLPAAMEQPVESVALVGKTKSSHKSTKKSNLLPQSQPPTNLSRASNKKRRKKLKLMKKAQAAANAAQALSTRAMAKSSSAAKGKAKSTPKKNTGAARASSKRVANIAVACARETMATYRKEMMMNKQTCA